MDTFSRNLYYFYHKGVCSFLSSILLTVWAETEFYTFRSESGSGLPSQPFQNSRMKEGSCWRLIH